MEDSTITVSTHEAFAFITEPHFRGMLGKVFGANGTCHKMLLPDTRGSEGEEEEGGGKG